MSRPRLTCLQCGHEWHPSVKTPKRCPSKTCPNPAKYSALPKNWWDKSAGNKRVDTKKMTLKEKLEYYSIPEPNTGCWLWIGATATNGYGTVHVNEKTMTAHRASYQEHIGPIPEGMCICHKCDVRSCINPDHLFLGTQKDNLQDAARKGRIPKGENKTNSKLTESQVVEIFNKNLSCAKLARDYDISKVVVQRIKTGREWKYLNLLAGGSK